MSYISLFWGDRKSRCVENITILIAACTMNHRVGYCYSIFCCVDGDVWETLWGEAEGSFKCLISTHYYGRRFVPIFLSLCNCGTRIVNSWSFIYLLMRTFVCYSSCWFGTRQFVQNDIFNCSMQLGVQSTVACYSSHNQQHRGPWMHKGLKPGCVHPMIFARTRCN